jgi:hypothetical protein
METTPKETAAPPLPEPQGGDPEVRTAAWADPDPDPQAKSVLRRVILR